MTQHQPRHAIGYSKVLIYIQQTPWPICSLPSGEQALTNKKKKNTKVISKPKVRFCQFSDNARNKGEIFKHCKKQVILQANNPRIKEIASLKKPIRIVNPTKSNDKDVSLNNCNISSQYGTISDNIRNMSLSNKSMAKVESTMILHDTNVIQNTKSCKMSQFDKSSQDDVLKYCAKSLQQKGKENKDNNHMQKVNVGDFKRLKMTKSQSVPSITKKRNSMIKGKILSAKVLPSHVLSHYKTATKNKISPVKKIVLRNVSGPKIKTSVEAGVFCKEQANITPSDANEKHIVVEDLTQPEYNSIIHTINKLKKLEQQKVITNISHLPFALKSFLNEKISAALDFPLDETIYKNLIDLNIDEKQLPSTVTRSKDPEPRQKDIIPKLSDFFIPEDTKEIYEAVHVKSRVSKIDYNWNAFKISNRILEWKYGIDD